MQRVTRTSALASLPAPPASPGTPGYFTGGNPGGGVPATVPGYEWFNGVQEELIAALSDGGLTPDAATLTQLRQSIRRLSAAGVTAVTGTTILTADAAGLVTVTVAAAATITLPAANAAGGRPMRLLFARLDATANTVTIQRAGSDAIEGQNTITLPVGARMQLVSDGVSSWRIGGVAGPQARMQAFTAGGTFTVPAGVYRVRVTCTGGGGGGAGSGTGNAGGGGGAGGTAIGWYDVTPNQAITVTIGAAGTAGISGGGTGGNGGTSSFGALLSAGGGSGGTVGASAGGGGAGTGGTLNIDGGAGHDGTGNVSSTVGGSGGASFWGGGGRAGAGGSGGGQAGTAFGSGGGGSYGSAGAGGAGRAGVVLVEW